MLKNCGEAAYCEHACRQGTHRPAGEPELDREGKLVRWLEQVANLAEDGVVRFRRVNIEARIAREFKVELHERSVRKLLRGLSYRLISVRPVRPQTDDATQDI